MISSSDIQENILTFTIILDRLGDLSDEILRMKPNPFNYDFSAVKGHWTRQPGNKELLRLERMIGDVQSFAKGTIGYLIKEKKQAMSCEEYSPLPAGSC